MYDDTCRYLAEHFAIDFARWLMGEAIALTELKPSELSLAPIRTDALILLESEATVLHLEFQTRPDPEIPFRMLDYRTRVYRKYPSKTMRQVVLYLKPSTSDRVYQTYFTLENTRHDFQVIRLWEQPAAQFLEYPGLFPFAVLGQSANPAEILRQVTQRVDQVESPMAQADLLSASAILAGLRLEQEVIHRLIRRDIMQESVIYRSIQDEQKRAIALNSLREGLSVEVTARITGLSPEDVQILQQHVNSSSQT